MKRLLLTIYAASLVTVATATNPALELEQVRAILRTNLAGMTEAELDRHALDGLLLGLRDRVWLVEEGTNAVATGIVRNLSLDEGIAYLRVQMITPAVAPEMSRFCQALDATNRLKGVVLDLRFATGDDYAAAAAVADLFVAEERGLLDWGAGVVKSSAKTNALTWPVAVLINGETMGAAEALAAVMRETGSGLLLGNPTRGAAVMTREFVLGNGQRLRLATAAVQLSGETVAPIGRVLPDISVVVTPGEERAYFENPYAEARIAAAPPGAALTGTNRVVRRPRTNEADLVRAHRSGNRMDLEPLPPREPEPEEPLLRDPALARAVDLLKGLAVVRRGQ